MSRHFSARRAEKHYFQSTASTAVLALILATPQAVLAQEASEQVYVTGSRLATDGYAAPSPLTVLNTVDIQTAAPTNLAEYVAQIPALAGMVSPQSSNASISSGTAGVNAVNLRALGVPRTLVLLDGRRSVASTVTGSVDINDFPQALVSRVEVVTGGASAVYGSDAVSGVVNFILDKKYTGIKGSIEGGITDYGDDPYRKFALTVGQGFFGGRMHVLVSGEYVDRDGIYGVPRKWNDGGNYIITNTAANITAGQPELLRVSGAGLTSTMGGIINSVAAPNATAATAALRGTYFGPGGAVGTLQYGSLVRDPWMVGGDWKLTQVNNSQSLDADERRKSAYGRLSYQVFDDFEVFFETSWNKHASLGWTGVQANLGPTGTTIQADNAFIPASVRTQLQSFNATSFVLATTNINLPIRKTDNDRTVERYTLGFTSTFDVLGTEFQFDGYIQHGVTQSHEVARDITNNSRLGFAQDAILVSGQIVCRNVTARANGCVPLNRMGTDVSSPAALAYVLGNPYREQTFEENVGGLNLRFNLFDGWGYGPVTFATGVEHREEIVSGKVPTEFRSGWFVGNYLPNFGYYQVTEGYMETLVPVWEGLDVNAAMRVTGYSTSGTVSTWKVGATYSPIDDVRFRASISRDIRAPNLNELFAAGTSRSNQLLDPFNGNTNTPFLEISTGNRNLRPEVARNMGIGAVFQPSFAPGLAFSVDYYNIQIKQAIASVDAQTIINRCFQGQTVYCAAVVRTGGNPPLQVTISGFNGSSNKAQGIDLEGSYTTPMADIYDGLDGTLAFRMMATHFLKNYTNNGVDIPYDTVGQNLGDGPPNWRYRFTATYNNDPWSVSFTGRGISSGVYNNRFVVCSIGCPRSTTVNQTINNNHIDGAIYFDMNLTFNFEVFGSDSQAYLGIQNIANSDPAIVAYGPAGVAYGNPSTNQQDYDILGRVYRTGIRFRFE
jgi:outer membrane receptor protein involved in Fe transport